MASDAMMEITDANFEAEVLKSDQPVLVDFWAEWCQPCKMLTPIVEEVAGEFEGKAKVGKLDCDSSRDVPVKYGISSIPTLLIFHKGEVAKKIVGLTGKDQIVEAINGVL